MKSKIQHDDDIRKQDQYKKIRIMKRLFWNTMVIYQKYWITIKKHPNQYSNGDQYANEREDQNYYHSKDGNETKFRLFDEKIDFFFR